MRELKVTLVIWFMILLTGCNDKGVSIGIIGGADGPTTIFISSKVSHTFLAIVICMVIVMLALIVKLIRWKKK